MISTYSQLAVAVFVYFMYGELRLNRGAPERSIDPKENGYGLLQKAY